MTREKIIQGLYKGDSRAIKEAIKALEKETVPKEYYDYEYFLRKEYEAKIAKLERTIETLKKV